jgi:hypothetical protein
VQLALHEGPQLCPVVPVESLQCFDLLLQRCPLGYQATNDVLIPLVCFALEFIGLCLSILGYLRSTCSRIRESLAGVPPSTVGMRPGVSGYLLCRRSRFGQHPVSLVLRAGDMLVSCSLGQHQYLKGLTLGVRPGMGRYLALWLVVSRRRS